MLLQPTTPFNLTPRPIHPYWLARGLHFLSLGDGTLWTRDLGWQFSPTITGTAYKPGPFGHAKGYYSTMGVGTTDRIAGSNIAIAEEVITCLSHFYQRGTGGNGVGRFWDFQGSREAWFPQASGVLSYARFVQAAAAIGTCSSALAVIAANRWTSAAMVHDQRVGSLPVKFYIEGVYKDEVNLSSAGALGAYPTNNCIVGNRDDAVRGFDGMLGPQMRFSHPISGLTQQELKLLSDNPGLLFESADSTWWIPVAGGGGSAALTGSALTYSAGTLGKQTTKALSGSAETPSAGTLAKQITKALSGSAETSNAGTLAKQITKALSGSSETQSAGTMTPSGNATAQLTGQAVTDTPGQLAAQIARALSGQSAPRTQGQLAVQIARALSGQSAARTQGQLAGQTAPTRPSSKAPGTCRS